MNCVCKCGLSEHSVVLLNSKVELEIEFCKRGSVRFWVVWFRVS